MIKTIRVMLIPNNKQNTKLFQYANTARFAYNWALGKEKDNYKNGGKFIFDGDLNMMIEQGATVTCCNSKTDNLKYYTQNADIVISAIGKAKYFDSTYFKKGQIIIDVGINKDEDGKLCGDVDGTYIYDSYVTPVPGGVGLLTRCQLVNNVVSAYYKRRKYNEKRISN